MAGAKTVVLVAGLALASLAVPASAQDFTYQNERFGTSATFPAEAFPDELEAPAEGDGLGWSSPQGANIFIYGRENVAGESPQSIIASRDAVDGVTYSKFGERWAVVSGFRDGQIFYERYIFRGDLIHSVSIRYPEALRSTYDPIVGPVTLTLRGPSSPS